MVLINRNFSLIWIGQFISQLGDKAYNIALMWWLLEKTDSSLFVSSFLVVSMLPELIFGPVAGVYIDRWDKKKILVASDFIRGVIVCVIAVLFQTDKLEVWHIYVAALFISFCSALFNPATMAIIPEIVGKEKLQDANSLSQMVSGAVAIAGPLLGASSVAMVGYSGVLVCNGISYLLSGLAQFFLQTTKTEAVRKESLLASLVEGIRFIGADQRVFVIVLMIAVVHIFVGTLIVMMPFIARVLDGNGINDLGILQSAIGAGMIVGAAYVTRYLRKSFAELYLFYAIVLMGLGVLSLGAMQFIQIRALVPYAGVCVFIGLSIAVASVFWRTIAQICVPAELTGRVFSVFSTIGNASLPISIAFFGVFLNYVSVGTLLCVAGGCLIVIGVLALLCNKKRFAGVLHVNPE